MARAKGRPENHGQTASNLSKTSRSRVLGPPLCSGRTRSEFLEHLTARALAASFVRDAALVIGEVDRRIGEDELVRLAPRPGLSVSEVRWGLTEDALEGA